MTSAGHLAYQALRDYLSALIASSLPSQPLDDVPAALHPELEVFMKGKPMYHDETGRRMLLATELAEWSTNLVHGTGLATPYPWLRWMLPHCKLPPGNRRHNSVLLCHRSDKL